MTFMGRNAFLWLWLNFSIFVASVDRKFSKLEGQFSMEILDTKHKVFNRMKCSTYCEPSDGCTGFYYDTATKDCLMGKILGSYPSIDWGSNLTYTGTVSNLVKI